MKVTDRSNFRVEFKGSFGVSDLPNGGGSFAAVADLVTVTAGAIDPRRLGDLGYVFMSDSMASKDVDGDYRWRCEEIVRLLREQFGSQIKAQVVFDETITCSFCYSIWEVVPAEGAPDYPDYVEFLESGDGPGLPVCCEAAQVEWRTAQVEVTA